MCSLQGKMHLGAMMCSLQGKTHLGAMMCSLQGKTHLVATMIFLFPNDFVGQCTEDWVALGVHSKPAKHNWQTSFLSSQKKSK